MNKKERFQMEQVEGERDYWKAAFLTLSNLHETGIKFYEDKWKEEIKKSFLLERKIVELENECDDCCHHSAKEHLGIIGKLKGREKEA